MRVKFVHWIAMEKEIVRMANVNVIQDFQESIALWVSDTLFICKKIDLTYKYQ